MKIKKSIIPKKQVFYNFESKAIFDWDISSKYSLDFSAIASFVALGFMLDDDTFYDKIKVLKPGYSYELENNIISKETNYWNWHYNPNYEITLNEIIEKFRYIFEEEILNNINDKSILLPISGGLDSRTLFVPVSKNKQLTLSSYEFENGYPESYVAKQLSNEFKIPLYVNKIQPSYLWGSLKNFYSYNNFFTDFLHPRQVYVMDRWKDLGETILLGH